MTVSWLYIQLPEAVFVLRTQRKYPSLLQFNMQGQPCRLPLFCVCLAEGEIPN